jgi:hypothetical protein
MAKYDFRRALESQNFPPHRVTRADNVLRNWDMEWYRSDETAAEDAARWIRANDHKILGTPNTGRKTLRLLELFADSILGVAPTLVPMEDGMFAAYNA